MNFQKFLSWGSALTLSGVLASGCGGSSTVSPRIAVPGVTNATSLVFMPKTAGLLDAPFAALSDAARIGTEDPSIRAAAMGASDIGTAATADLTSLQYYITIIRMCKTIEVSGSAYNNPTGCSVLFGTDSTDNAYTTFKVAQAEADTSTSWVDLMSKTSLDRFASNSGSVSAGEYNYVLVESRKPIKMNVQFSAGNAANMRTCTGGTVTESGSGDSLRETVTVSDMTSCTRATATLGSQGGGNWFKFASPITVEGGKTYVLDLGFDSDSYIVGGVSAAGGFGSAGNYVDSTRTIYVPKIEVAPVLRESSSKLVREQYELSSISGVTGKIRINLYYAGTSSQVGTGTIQGVEVRFIHDNTSTTMFQVAKAYSVTASGSSISLKDYQGIDIVTDLTRSSTTTSGGTSTATFNKASIYSSGLSGTASATVTFKGVVEL